ncbi:CrcB protein [Thermanaerovibrio acidaminovorans DSM 6589]|jgi:CrcB protein|uniref:Fluoride-specific ion channel FluC n=1 Tax=Thermanaerovibrio acidaminovorans (strain ATCC 49978 / DSM 6589 / Su883) TaxID=525903 RepID=D1B6Q4_THEAS|nr:fluoride efflux transporter CrcB [Thermanaerovibrio acidaminovorans]ACZ19695.1 CrcB protein [Thermanaerovibrio acidaminovorans DSM 6589]
MEALYVALGGGAGALARYLMSTGVQQRVNGVGFPVGTVVVNIVGCFLAGFVWTLLSYREVDHHIRLALMVGFLGGFTTFSSFALETVNMLRQSNPFYAVLNVLIQNGAGILSLWMGALVGGFTG